MAVATGIAPRHLLELDAEMFDAVRLALARRWTMETELAAATLEVAHAAAINAARVHSKKGARFPRPLAVRRPEREAAPAAASSDRAPRRVSIREVVAMAAHSNAQIIEVPADAG